MTNQGFLMGVEALRYIGVARFFFFLAIIAIKLITQLNPLFL